VEVRITGRHGATPDEVKEYAHDKLSPIGKFNRHARSLEIVLDEDHLSKTVEVIAHLDRGAPVVVHSKHEDARAAIDLAHDKLEKVLRRHKERIEDRRRVRGEPGFSPAPSADEEE
jgi:putative sigma-54 modulation protein